MTKCNNEYKRDWSSLPANIVGAISSRLTYEDYDAFANVCTSWRSSKGPLSPQMPFLFLHKTSKLFNSSKLLNLTNNRCLYFDMPLIGNKACKGTLDGWLIFADDTTNVFSLYNPFSQQEIKLPSHHDYVINELMLGEECNSCFQKVVLSCLPTSSTTQNPGAVVLSKELGSIMYKQEGQVSWNSRSWDFADITYWMGSFVGVDHIGDVYKFDLDVPVPEFKRMCNGAHDQNDPLTHKLILELDGNLLQVWRFRDEETYGTLAVKVMQLDTEKLTWNPIDDLYGHSLFLSDSYSSAFSSHKIPGLKANLIYIEDLEINVGKSNNARENYKRLVKVFNMSNDTYEIPLEYSTSAFWFAPPPSELQASPIIPRKYIQVLRPTNID